MSKPSIGICLIGSGGVGKSSLTLQFMYDEYVSDYEPTKSASYNKTVSFNGNPVDISILDTAGQEEYVSVKDALYLTGDAFIIVFSLSDVESFKCVGDYIERLQIVRSTGNVPKVLVGNKADLTEKIQVSPQMISELTEKYNIPYFETSAKTKNNVDKVFDRVIHEVWRVKSGSNNPTVEPVSHYGKKCCALI